MDANPVVANLPTGTAKGDSQGQSCLSILCNLCRGPRTRVTAVLNTYPKQDIVLFEPIELH